MRDLMFMLAPVALIIYFVVYPDQFNALLTWAGQFALESMLRHISCNSMAAANLH